MLQEGKCFFSYLFSVPKSSVDLAAVVFSSLAFVDAFSED